MKAEVVVGVVVEWQHDPDWRLGGDVDGVVVVGAAVVSVVAAETWCELEGEAAAAVADYCVEAATAHRLSLVAAGVGPSWFCDLLL